MQTYLSLLPFAPVPLSTVCGRSPSATTGWILDDKIIRCCLWMPMFPFLFLVFICTIVSVLVKAQFHACIWCQCEMIVQCHCVWLLVPRKEKCNAKETFASVPVSWCCLWWCVLVLLFLHMIWFCTIGIFFLSGSLWLLGSCRDSKWSHAKCLAYIFFFPRRLEDGGEGEGGREACWSRTVVLLALLPSLASSTRQYTANTHTHTRIHAHTVTLTIQQPGLSSAG